MKAHRDLARLVGLEDPRNATIKNKVLRAVETAPKWAVGVGAIAAVGVVAFGIYRWLKRE